MSATPASLADNAHAGGRPSLIRLRAYFWSDGTRRVQTVLGLLWLLAGGLQFQSFMYGKGFIQFLQALTTDQPGWVASSVNQGAATMQSHQVIFNTGAALIQILIGFGILYKRTTKPAIVLSFAWALGVWWFGEAFGMMFMATTSLGGIAMASPLTGAPGAVLMYVVIGAMVWPNGRPGGLLGVLGARAVWGILWLVMAWLWLVEGGGPNGIHNAINAAPSGMSWLSSLQNGFASITQGNGFIFAVVLAVLSAAIAIAVVANWRAKDFLILAAMLNLIYWLVGQGFGGIFQGGATDPNAGPLYILLAYTMYNLVPYDLHAVVKRDDPAHNSGFAPQTRDGAMSGAPVSWHRAGWLPMGLRLRRILAGLTAGLLLAGCAKADKNQSASSSSSSGMAGMKMGGSGSTTAVPEVNGQKPVATQLLATAHWQGVEIQAQARTPVRFVVFNGTKEQMVDPSKNASFHLMIMLSDERTGEPIPYSSSVWATITNSKGKVVFGDQQWPMISRYMGPHYGNDVPHLASGRYKLSVLIGPPTFARDAEYKNVWLKPHNVTTGFAWNAKAATATVIGAGKSTNSGPLGSIGDMTGMNGMSIHTNVSVNGVRATPSRLIATAYWQGMRIQTRTATPTRFYMYVGKVLESVDPVAGSSFYMMVMLNDKDSSEAITYAPVYATIRNAVGKVVYHGQLEPTISAFEGPYYGNNTKLPGAGHYTLTLRIDPPHQARHLEYQHVWLHPHTLVEHFVWKPAA